MLGLPNPARAHKAHIPQGSSSPNAAKFSSPAQGPICQGAQWPIKIDQGKGVGRCQLVTPNTSPILELGLTCTSMRCNKTDFSSHQVR